MNDIYLEIRSLLDEINQLVRKQDYASAANILEEIRSKSSDKKYLLVLINLALDENRIILNKVIFSKIKDESMLKARSELISHFRKIKFSKICQ